MLLNRNFNSIIPVDVITVESYLNSFLDPTSVPLRVSSNKLQYLVPKQIVSSLVGMLRNHGGLGMSNLYMPVVVQR